MSCEIIAEFASNWGGNQGVWSRMLDEAVSARVDRIKIQSYQVRHLARDDPQYDWLARAEVSDHDHGTMIRACAKVGMGFLTTVFHQDRVRFLADLGLDAIKIGSGEASNPVLLECVAKHPWKVYLSTGLLTREELERAVDILGGHDLVLMHAVSEYPTVTARVNLPRLTWLAQKTMLPVGYSDHTTGLHAPLTAIAQGAAAVEVHTSARGEVPRRSAWDKDVEDLTTLTMFRDTVDQMMTPGKMLWGEGEARPYVGRWQHALRA